MKLKGKTALIVGASRNMGKAVALTFAQEGAELVINARGPGPELEAVAEQCRSLGAPTVAVMADITDAAQVRRVVSQSLDRFGKIDILVSTVAARPFKPTLEINDEEWRWVMATNVDSLFYLCKAVAPSMMARRTGSIIAFGNLPAERIARPVRGSHLLASKAAITTFIRVLAVELGGYGIRCNAIRPGVTDTEVKEAEWYSHVPKKLPRTLEEVPLKRSGRVEEVAATALFLASDDSSYVTGHVIACDGGLFL